MDRREFVVVSTSSLFIAATGVVGAEEIEYQFDGAVVFQGQPVTASGDAVDAETEYELWEVDAFDTGQVSDSSFVSGVESDDNGEITIETDSLGAADYFLRGDGLPFQPDQEQTFEVTLQSLDIDLEHVSVEEGLGTTIDIDSNRGRYAVDIDSTALTASVLTTIFTADGGFELAAEQPSDGSIRLENDADRSGTTIFDVAPDEYTIEFSVPDTTATDTATTLVSEADQDVTLSIGPAHRTIEPTHNTSFTVQLSGASGGLGSYSFDIELETEEVASISAVELNGADTSDSGTDVQIGDRVTSVTVQETAFSRLQTATIATVGIDAEPRDGIATDTISLGDVTVSDTDEAAYSISGVTDAELVVEPPEWRTTSATGVVWRGQTAVEDAGHIDPEMIYNLRFVDATSDGAVESSSFVTQIAPTDAGQLEIETADLNERRYFFRGGDFDVNPDVEDTFQVIEQDLSAEFAEETIETDGQSGLIFTSNRATYPVVVSGGDLSEPELIDAFVTNGTFDLEDAFVGADDRIVVAVPESGTDIVDFDGRASGSYEFEFETPVTNAEANTTITVGDVDEPTGVLYEVVITDPGDGASVASDQNLAVTVEVTNTGDTDGTQTVDLTEPIGQRSDSVALDPGETESINFVIPSEDLSSETAITVESDETTDSITVSIDDCFIATASYGTPMADEIDVLRAFRDEILDQTWVGKQCIAAYYRISPPIAAWIRRTDRRRYVVRESVVEPLVTAVKRFHRGQ